MGGRENKDNLGRMKQTPLRKLIIDLANIEMIGSTWREAHRLERIDMTISMIKRISTPIEIWEHRLKGMESTLDTEATQIPQLKTKQRIGLQK